MSVDTDEVRRIADLAKLSLGDDEVRQLADEMSRILDHALRLREVGTVEGQGGAASGLPPADDRSEAVSPAADAPASDGGTRRAAPRKPSEAGPDALHHPTRSFAPDMREGFFVVPPPPGVVDATEAGRDGEER